MKLKQKDIAMIIIVTFISAVVSYFASNFLFGGSSHRSTKVEVVDQITDQFTNPDDKYFNEDSINPTRLISIGDSSNPDPFANTGQ
jgi:hypothetical protein